MLTPRRVSIPLSADVAETLRALSQRLSQREYRHPRDQAAKLLVEALERAGALPAEQAAADRASDRPAVTAA
jgi:hypothetical protein